MSSQRHNRSNNSNRYSCYYRFTYSHKAGGNNYNRKYSTGTGVNKTNSAKNGANGSYKPNFKSGSYSNRSNTSFNNNYTTSKYDGRGVFHRVFNNHSQYQPQNSNYRPIRYAAKSALAGESAVLYAKDKLHERYAGRGIFHRIFTDDGRFQPQKSSKRFRKYASKTILTGEAAVLMGKDAVATAGHYARRASHLVTNHFTGKETHIRFDRKTTSSGKSRPSVTFVRTDKPVYREPGLFHRARDFGRRFENFPSFSVERKINNIQPKNKRQAVLRRTALTSYKSSKLPFKAAGKAALVADTVAYRAGQTGFHKLTGKGRAEFNSNDTGKAALSGITAFKTVSRTRKALVQHHLRKKSSKLKRATYRAEKAKVKKAREEYKKQKKAFKDSRYEKKTAIKYLKLSKKFDKAKTTANPNEQIKKINKFAKKKKRLDKKLNKRLTNKFKRAYNASGGNKAVMSRARKGKLDAKKKVKKISKAVNTKSGFYRTKKKAFKRNLKQERKVKKVDKKLYKNQKQFKKNARKNKHLDMAKPLALSGLAFAGGTAFSKAWGKIMSDAYDNDAAKAVNAVAKTLNTARRTTVGVSTRFRHKQANKRTQKTNKKHNKLKQRKNRLKMRNSKKAKKRVQKRAKKAQKQSTSVVKSVLKALINALKFIIQMFAALAAPILIIILIVALVLMTFGGLVSNSSYIIGTYNCRDYDLGKAVEHYTWLADKMNKSILKCQNESEWREGLKELGVSTTTISSYRDNPTDFIFGESDELPYPAIYDYDEDKLAAFMCAYTYNFSENNKDIEQWCYKDNQSEYEAAIKKLFDTEYKFRYKYINLSHWVPTGTFKSTNDCRLPGTVYPSTLALYGTADDKPNDNAVRSHYINGVYYYSIKFDSMPSVLNQYAKDDRVYLRVSGGRDKNGDSVYAGEIVNANENYTKTGYRFQDLTQSWRAADGTELNSVYVWNQSRGEYGFNIFNSSGIEVWQSKHDIVFTINGVNYNFNYCMTNRDARIWISTQGGEQSDVGNRLLTRFWQEEKYIRECKLYTTVEQKMSFEDAILTVLRQEGNADERIQFYYTLEQGNFKTTNGDAESRTYGNHQTFLSPLKTDYEKLISDGRVFNRYGYDMQGWCKKHCNLESFHRGMDFIANPGEEVRAVTDGKVIEIDTDNHKLVLQANGVDYWYEENSRDTKIYYVNINPTVSVGDTVKAGQKIGVVDYYKHCITDNDKITDNKYGSSHYLHITVRIQYDAVWEFGYEFVDPHFLFYRSNDDNYDYAKGGG